MEMTIEQIYEMFSSGLGANALNEVKQQIRSKITNKAVTEEMPKVIIHLVV